LKIDQNTNYAELKRIAVHLDIIIPDNMPKKELIRAIENHSPYKDLTDEDLIDLAKDKKIANLDKLNRDELEYLLLKEESMPVEKLKVNTNTKGKVLVQFKNRGSVTIFGVKWTGFKKEYLTREEANILINKFPNRFREINQ